MPMGSNSWIVRIHILSHGHHGLYKNLPALSSMRLVATGCAAQWLAAMCCSQQLLEPRRRCSPWRHSPDDCSVTQTLLSSFHQGTQTAWRSAKGIDVSLCPLLWWRWSCSRWHTLSFCLALYREIRFQCLLEGSDLVQQLPILFR